MSVPTAKKYWTVEIIYKADAEVKRFRLINLDSAYLKWFRENVVSAGAYRKIDEYTGEVILPWHIRSFMVYQQQCFINKQDAAKPLTQDKKQPTK